MDPWPSGYQFISNQYVANDIYLNSLFWIKIIKFFFYWKLFIVYRKHGCFLKLKKKTLISINTYTKSEINTKKVQIYCFFFRLSSCNISCLSLDKIRIAGVAQAKKLIPILVVLIVGSDMNDVYAKLSCLLGKNFQSKDILL